MVQPGDEGVDHPFLLRKAAWMLERKGSSSIASPIKAGPETWRAAHTTWRLRGRVGQEWGLAHIWGLSGEMSLGASLTRVP